MDFNRNLEASVQSLSPGLQQVLKQYFGDRVEVSAEGAARWSGDES